MILMERNKVCIILPSFLPVPATKGGAVETIIENLVIENEKYENFDFTILSNYEEKAFKLSMKYKFSKFIYFKTSRLLDKLLLLIYKCFRKIVIAVPSSTLILQSLRYIKKNNFDYILLEAGEVYVLKCFSKFKKNSKLLIHVHWNPKFCNSYDFKFDYYIGVSDFITNQWKHRSTMDEVHFVTLPNCININNFKKKISIEEKIELKKSLGINDECVCIYTGRLVEEKGVRELIKAISYLKNENIKLLIIGSSNFAIKSKTKFEMEMNELFKENIDKIIFIGFVKNTDLYKYYSISDISIIPSIFEDPAPLVVLEAMSAAKPIITTATGGMSEYLVDGGYLKVDRNKLDIDLYEKILYLIKNKELRERMGEINCNSSENFDFENYYKRFTKILNM